MAQLTATLRVALVVCLGHVGCLSDPLADTVVPEQDMTPSTMQSPGLIPSQVDAAPDSGASPASSILELRSTLKSTLAQASSHLQAVAEHCPDDHHSTAGSKDASLYCNGARLNSLSTDLESTANEALSRLDPVSNALDSLGQSQSSMDKLDKLLAVAAPALTVASKIPYVGPVFNGVKAFISPLKTAASTLDDSLTSVDSTVVRPWQKSVGVTLDKLELFKSKMAGVSPFIELVGGVLGAKCLGPIISKLPGIGAVEKIAKAAVGLTSKLVTLIAQLVKYLSGQAWKAIQSVMEKVSTAVSKVSGGLKFLEPLSKLLSKKIKIPWITTPYKRKDYGKPQCAAGYSIGKLKTKCWETCKKGYYSAASVTPKCKMFCADGKSKPSPTTGCPNPSGYEKKIVSTKARRRRGTNWKGTKCPSGYKRVAFTQNCRKECKGGEKSAGDSCYPACRAPYTARELQPARCNVHAYNKKWRFATCTPYIQKYGPGYAANCNKMKSGDKNAPCQPGDKLSISSNKILGISGNCLQDCKPGELEIGKSCWKEAKLEFSISDIAQKLQAIIDKISGLPIVNTIQKAIESLVNKILKPVISQLGKVFKLPPLNINLPEMSIDELPIGDLVKGLTQGISLPKIDELTGVVDKFTAPFTKAFDKLNIKLPGAGCASPSCLMKGLGMPDFSKVLDPITSMLDPAKAALKKALGDGVTCKKWTSKKVDLAEAIKGILGEGAEGADTGYDMPLCEELSLTPNKLKQLGKDLSDLITPLEPELNKILSGGKTKTSADEELLEGTNAWDDFKEGFEASVTDFEVPFFLMPLEAELAGSFQNPWGKDKQDIYVKIAVPGGTVKDTSIVGWQFRLMPSVKLYFYLKRLQNRVSVQIKLSGQVYFRVSRTDDVRGVIVQSNKIAQDVIKTAQQEAPECFPPDPEDDDDIPDDIPKICVELCKLIRDLQEMKDAPKDCTQEFREEHENNQEWLKTHEAVKWAGRCTTYIDNKAKEIYEEAKKLMWGENEEKAGLLKHEGGMALQDVVAGFGVPVELPTSLIGSYFPNAKWLYNPHRYGTDWQPTWTVGMENLKEVDVTDEGELTAKVHGKLPERLELRFNMLKPISMVSMNFGTWQIGRPLHKSKWWKGNPLRAHKNRWGFLGSVRFDKIIYDSIAESWDCSVSDGTSLSSVYPCYCGPDGMICNDNQVCTANFEDPDTQELGQCTPA